MPALTGLRFSRTNLSRWCVVVPAVLVDGSNDLQTDHTTGCVVEQPTLYISYS